MMLSDYLGASENQPSPLSPKKDLVFVLMFFCLVFGGVGKCPILGILDITL